ncbi:MAG: hypothetical protein KDB11_29165, partial [Planctomycetales bacterium]|nr:hypothetical protein [Planctomycetales bacterium]
MRTGSASWLSSVFRSFLPPEIKSRRRTQHARRVFFESLEDRRLLTVEWRNPVNALDVSDDGALSPLDPLQVINELIQFGSHPLPTQRSVDKPYWDVSGDNFVSPLDALQAINALNLNLTIPYLLSEGPSIVSERNVTITVGQTEGTRSYRLRVIPSLETSGPSTSSSDVFSIYLVDPHQQTQTLLDRGVNGTSLFSLSNAGAEFVPGRVRWDGEIVDIDLSDVTDRDTAELRLQLLNGDGGNGSRVAIRPLLNEVDLDGVAMPLLLDTATTNVAGSAFNLTDVEAANDVAVKVENVRYSSVTQRYAAELRLQNQGDSLAQSVAVAFPDLPAGVTLRNPSGTIPGGAPYLNFFPAIARGGLPTNARSERLLVEFDNPGNLPFVLSPQVFGGANHPPTLAAIGPLTVTPGGIFRTQFSATDPEGDAITYSLRFPDSDSASPLELPNSTVQGDGTYIVRPTPNQIGSYTFDVVASDGALLAARTVTLNVIADTETTTRVSGKVLQVNGQPLAGMQVEIGAVQGLTMADGSFQLDLGSGTIISDTIKVRGELFSGSLAYPFIAEKLPLILEHDIYTSVNNVIDRPIYLPALNVAGGATIDPMHDMSVRQEIAPGEMAEVFVAAGTLMTQQGTPFTGTLSITEVPPSLTPAALPEGLSPDLVVTIQPGEMVFSRPAPLSLPNRAGRGPGTVMDLWSINPVTGEFEDVGDLQVSADGKTIDTISGGVRNSSWHFASEPGVSSPSRGKSRTGELGCNACKYDSEASSRVEQYSGTIIESHDLPMYQSQGIARGVQLVYDSLRADPRPIIHFGADNLQSADELFPFLSDAVRYAAKVTIDRGNFHYVVPGTPNEVGGYPVFTGLGQDYHFWKLPPSAGSADAALQVDLRAEPTGVYIYDVESGVYFLRPPGGCGGSSCVPPPPQFVGTATTYSDPLVVVNEIESPFGAGWGIVGLQRLTEEADRTVLIVDGDGSELVFRFDAQQNKYISPPGDFSELKLLIDGRFRRETPDRMVYQFDGDGRLVSETDRNNNATRYGYDAQGRLTSITDPVNLVTVFTYTNGLLSSITDPANRQTLFEHDASGNLTRITDPDGSSRTWGYDADHHIVSEVDQLGRYETTEYGTHGRAIGGVHKDGSTYVIRAPQAQSIAKPGSTIGMNPTAQMESLSDQVVATSLDGNGNGMMANLDPAGQVVRRSDSLGAMPSTQREDNNLPITTTDARGFVRANTFDDRGNLLTSRDSLSIRIGDDPGVIGLIAGTIQFNGQADHYSFAGKAGELLYIDRIQGTSSAINVHLTTDPSLVYDLLPVDGTYQVDITNVGEYVAQLLSLDQAPQLQLGSHAGNVSVGQDLVYRVALQRDQRLRIVDEAPINNANWMLRGVDGSGYSFTQEGVDSAYEFVVPADGEYVVLREASPSVTRDVVPFRFTATVTTPLTALAKSGLGLTHSGTLQVGEEQTFSFSAPAGTMIYFDRQFQPDPNRDFADLTLLDAVGKSLTGIFDQGGSIRLNDSGEFRVVAANPSQFGPTDFKFRILDLADAPILSIGESLSDTVHSGEAAIYRLAGKPGQQVITRRRIDDQPAYLATNQVVTLDERGESLVVFDSSSLSEGFRWQSLDARRAGPLTLDQNILREFTVGDDLHYYRFTAESGSPMFFERLGSILPQYQVFGESGTSWDSVLNGTAGFTLHTGSFAPEGPKEYFLVATMEDPTYLPNAYGFQLHSQHTSSAAITIGQTVTGNLDWVEVDTQTFEGRAGQWLYFNSRQFDTSFDQPVSVTMLDPNGYVVPFFIDATTDGDPFQLGETGTYRIEWTLQPVARDAVVHRDYQYRLFDLAESPLATFLSPLERPLQNGAATEVYRFAATAGQRVTFTQSDPANTSLRAYTNRGVELRDSANESTLTMTFGETATYYLLVAALDQSLTTPVPTRWTIADASEPDVTASGFDFLHDGEAQEGETVATFAGNAGSRILYEAGFTTESSYISLHLLGPSGELIAVLPAANSSFVMLPRSGTYTAQVHGQFGPLEQPARYRFRFRQLAELPTLEQGTLQTISPGSEADLGMRFQVRGAGRQVWVDLIPPDDFNELLPFNQPSVYSYTNSFSAESSVGYGNTAITIPNGSPLVVGARTELDVDSYLRVFDVATVPQMSLDVESTGTLTRVHDDMLWRFTAVAGEKRLFQVDSRNYAIVNLSDPQSYVLFNLPTDPTEITPGRFAFEAVADFPQTGDYLLVRRGTFGDPLEYAAKVSHFAEQTLPLVGGTLSQTGFTYEPVFNQVTSKTDEQGRQTLFDIDPANGNVRSAIQVIGTVGEGDDLLTTFTYTVSGQIDTITNPLGYVTDYDYDQYGRLITITFARGLPEQSVQRIEYDLAGNVAATIDGNGNRAEMQYDSLNRMTRLTSPDPDGAGPLASPITLFGYDAAGNLLSVTDPEGHLSRRTYDLRDRIVTTTDPGQNVTRNEYDQNGNVTRVTDPLGNTSRFVYDARNRMIESIDAAGGQTKFTYDLDDHLTSLTDASGNSTRYAYDARGRMIAETDPLGAITTYSYDGTNAIVLKVDALGRRTEYAYDDASRVTREHWVSVDGTEANVIEYMYDEASRLVQLHDTTGDFVFTYDALGRMTSERTSGPNGLPTVVLDASFDAVGNRLSVADSINGQTGATNTNKFDALNRTTQISQEGTGVATKRVDLGYNSLNQLTSLIRASDAAGTSVVAATNFTFDALNRLSVISHRNAAGTVLASFTYQYDSASRITRITDIDGATDYSYDPRNQLTGANHADAANPDEIYAYDATGNRTSSQRHGMGYATGAGNRLATDGTNTYEYDAEGNLVKQTTLASGAVRDFAWDHRNRLVRVADRTSATAAPTQVVDYTYDAANRRIAKTVGGVTTYFVYDGDDVIVELTDPDASGPQPAVESMRYLHGSAVDQVFAQEGAAGNVLWHLTDHLGSVRDLVDNSGTVANHLKYDGFGNVISQSNPEAATRYQFTGREFDDETDLHFYRARYYDAETGRFIGEDPIGFIGGDYNLFEYVRNRPVSSSDPSGLILEEQVGGEIGGSGKRSLPSGLSVADVQAIINEVKRYGYFR